MNHAHSKLRNCHGYIITFVIMCTIVDMVNVSNIKSYIHTRACTKQTYMTGFTKTILISTRNEIQFIADY